MKTECIPVILSGGAGTRLWPLSRRYYPKQFIPLFNGKDLFTQTLERIMPLQPKHIVVVCNEAHRFMVMDRLRSMKLENCTIIAEPESRNTAPAIALASFWIQRQFQNTAMLILPSDHYMEGNKFAGCIDDTLIRATENYFIAFGIKAIRSETGYGYIKIKQSEISTDEQELQTNVRLKAVDKFVEKPAQETAEEYIKTGLHYWNSGIFVFTPKHYLAALREHQSQIYDACERAAAESETGIIEGYNIINPAAQYFKQSPDISIDYAIMECVKNICLCPIDIHWSDLGSWQALSETQNSDANGNRLSGEGNIVVQDCKDNIVYADNKLVVCLGIDNHLVAETKDALLIADRSRGQEVKQIVDTLRMEGYSESDLHTKVYRPWGSYESIDIGENFQVKRIIVNPGQQLSLQSHKKRAEHWVVVKGCAVVTLNAQILNLQVNQSVYIPIGAKHRLENQATEPLHLIEVQCGEYLGEDDIERYEDNYGRVNE
ncbi:MAG: mannose-1-phosphate guanylyltransferase/mannose-6-phosphate isomerase [Chromatiales bacterium]|nr:mannose-1-phosphate guanylyltransferase/mannose-6-phosphate isomerase [Chromatiales bacterium]